MYEEMQLGKYLMNNFACEAVNNSKSDEFACRLSRQSDNNAAFADKNRRWQKPQSKQRISVHFLRSLDTFDLQIWKCFQLHFERPDVALIPVERTWSFRPPPLPRRPLGSFCPGSPARCTRGRLGRLAEEFLFPLLASLASFQIGVIGGSFEYTGAPYFAAISALKAV